MSVSDRGSESGSLADAAYEKIRESIVTCRLAPGLRITERGVATELGLGISPIREALTRLDHEGLVRTIPRKGYQVSPLTVKGVDDLFEFWEILGPVIVQRGLTNGTPDQRAQAISGFEEILNAGTLHTHEDVKRSVELSDRTFQILAESSGNEYLLSTYLRVSAALQRVWALILTAETVLHVPIDPPAGAQSALARGDSVATADCALNYIQQFRSSAQYILMQWPSVVATEIAPLQ